MTAPDDARPRHGDFLGLEADPGYLDRCRASRADPCDAPDYEAKLAEAQRAYDARHPQAARYVANLTRPSGGA